MLASLQGFDVNLVTPRSGKVTVYLAKIDSSTGNPTNSAVSGVTVTIAGLPTQAGTPVPGVSLNFSGFMLTPFTTVADNVRAGTLQVDVTPSSELASLNTPVQLSASGSLVTIGTVA